VDPEIIVLRAIIKKEKKKEINEAKYIALPASGPKNRQIVGIRLMH